MVFNKTKQMKKMIKAWIGFAQRNFHNFMYKTFPEKVR